MLISDCKAGEPMNIRQATEHDLTRIAEMLVFNYRLQFYPIFRNDDFYFGELTVSALAEEFRQVIQQLWVYDDGLVKGFVQLDGREIKKLFVEPVLQGNGIGAELLMFAVSSHGADTLWALEKNVRAIRFYQRHGFRLTEERELEEDTTEYLVRMERRN